VKYSFVFLLAAYALAFTSCGNDWRPGTPLAKEKVKIGVVHITNPFNETSGYSYAHQSGIDEMRRNLSLNDSQIIYRTNVDDVDQMHIEGRMREMIAQGAKIIIATSWGYMDTCEKLSAEFPSVIFANATGYKYNETNFTNYFGRLYQARYLSGIAAGLKTKTNMIGFVAARGTDNSEVTGGLNAFAMGAHKVNPNVEVFVRVTHSWFDPMGEASAARALIALGCDVIAQHCDTAVPQLEAQRAGVLGIGYNTDMKHDAPDAVLTSVIWHWGVYYTNLVRSVIDGTFKTDPWFGSLRDGIIDLAPLNDRIEWDDDTSFVLNDMRRQLESETFNIYSGVIQTNDGRNIGLENEIFSDSQIRNNINWYYKNIKLIR